MTMVVAGIVAGAFIGLPALHFGGIEIGLSFPVGVLLGGLVCGWLRSMRPSWCGDAGALKYKVFDRDQPSILAVILRNHVAAQPDDVTLDDLASGPVYANWLYSAHLGSPARRVGPAVRRPV
jgi:hypothetical protein